MKIEAARYIKPIVLLCLLFVAAHTQALVMGDLQVGSSLGQPLSASIAFADLSDVDVQQLKIRLAGADDYRKLGMQYPESHKFRFALVNEPGAMLPFIRVTTSYPLDDPFINLLVEVSSPAGKLFKAYTFLLDPAAEFSDYQLPVVQPQVTPPQSGGAKVKADVMPVKARVYQVKKRKKPAAAVRTEHRSQMKLAMSLSISSYDPVQADSRDALQEELIAKEKALQELNLQIGEMQTVIKSLQDKRAQASSSVVDVSAASPVVASSLVEAPVKVVAAVVPPAPQAGKLNTGLAIAALLLAGIGGFGYLKYRRMQAWQHGPFDEENDEEVAEADVQERVFIKPEPAVATMLFPTVHAPFTSHAGVDVPSTTPEEVVPLTFERIAVGERTIETAAYAERAVPPEYAILMEANRHLRAGHDDLAEASLNQAISANPKNLYGYQALLGIYEKRGDLPGFERIAQQIKTLGEETAFNEAAVRGRALDPENSLYQIA
jgi:hypothetical protein